ncbi:MAG: nucleotide sugar dehydrogenase [Anaerolineae bacterium]|jgi:UDP-N-acetyl-D-glucosamine dehydrogenase|nr:nucleotide sugar dehydrogenase [Anaerolineae bacterium]MDX9830951.1 nucleotide sugar dehydrogenase [Anaerolineae bacterium]
MEKIVNRSARVAVIGLGYVGLPLAVGFARAGYPVLGLDVDPRKVAAIAEGRSYIQDVASADLAAVVASGRLTTSSDYRRLREMDAIFICVPTPFDARKAPDLSYIEQAARGIAEHLQPGQLVVLQSTTYPGTTEEFVLPLLEESGLKAGQEFHLAFSPERINPGDKHYTVENTPKVVGGLTPQCTELARALLAQLFAHVHVVSSPRAAEMTKLLENIFRSVNIALVNELALLSERMGIDLWEVIDAAKTKPFGFMPFYPGPGVGGHCIPVDPYYLSWKAREYDFYTKFIELAAEVNLAMPYHVVDIVGQALSQEGKVLSGARVLIVGVAFKRDIDDARNSPAERIIELLLRRGADVCYSDPYVPRYRVGRDVFFPEERWLEHVELSDQFLATVDCAVIVAGHRAVDYNRLLQSASLVVDTDNSTRGLAGTARVVRIGAPPELQRE